MFTGGLRNYHLLKVIYFFLLILFIIIFFVCVGSVYIRPTFNSLFLPCEFQGQNSVHRSGGKCLYLLSHLDSPSGDF